jgi:hypothetical protein
MKLYKNSSRYTKVNQQKKFHLLSLVLREHLAIKEVILDFKKGCKKGWN